MLATKLKGSLDSRSSFKRPLNFDVHLLSNSFCLATAFPPNQSYVCRAQPWTRTKLKSGLNHISQALPPPRKVFFFRVSVCFFHDGAVPRTRCLQHLGFVGGAQKQTATVPSQDRPWEVTPERLSLHTLQKVGRAWEQAYQLCIPEKCSTLNWATCKGKVRTGLPKQETTAGHSWLSATFVPRGGPNFQPITLNSKALDMKTWSTLHRSEKAANASLCTG